MGMDRPSAAILTCYVEHHRWRHHAGADQPVGDGQVHHETVGYGAQAACGQNGEDDECVANHGDQDDDQKDGHCQRLGPRHAHQVRVHRGHTQLSGSGSGGHHIATWCRTGLDEQQSAIGGVRVTTGHSEGC